MRLKGYFDCVQTCEAKKISEVRRTWQIISDSASPEEWSEKMRTPSMGHRGLEHHSFIKQYSNISNMSEG